MGSLFQSDEMALCQIFLPTESVYDCLSVLGEAEVVQLQNLNEDRTEALKFIAQVQKCESTEVKLTYLNERLDENKIKKIVVETNPEAPKPKDIDNLISTIEMLTTEVENIETNYSALKQNYIDLIEYKYVLRKMHLLFDEIDTFKTEDVFLLGEERSSRLDKIRRNNKLSYIAGVMPYKRFHGFELMLWRTCHDNILLKQFELKSKEDYKTEVLVKKLVFVIFFSGDFYKTKIKAICEGFSGKIYPIPEHSVERRQLMSRIDIRIEDLKTVLFQTKLHRIRVLTAVAKNINIWVIKIKKVKTIFNGMNKMNYDETVKYVIAECWIPVKDIEKAQNALLEGNKRSDTSAPPILNRIEIFEDPPTYFRTNKVTKAFHMLIDSYGTASYREMNPSPFAIVTFPFLFAIMFGDTGHGIFVMFCGMLMILKEKSLSKNQTDSEIWNLCFNGRYIIFLMGLFSIYTGMIYNEMFCLSMNIFGSKWRSNYNLSDIMGNNKLTLDPATNAYFQYPYPFGVDPLWKVAKNKIIFFNSFKMKLSIIIGIFHMVFGVLLSLRNHIYFKNRMNIYCEFIPQIVFTVSLFGYMMFLMFFKWVKYYSTLNESEKTSSSLCAPSILITFINMVLFRGTPKNKVCNNFMMFPYQEEIQKVLVIIALVCVPWMLLMKPICLIHKHHKSHTPPQIDLDVEEDIELGAEGSNSHLIQQQPLPPRTEENFDLGEIFIHQTIHTIEYVLNSVSHTASYLRLWALSLAHNQLSDVLWNMVLAKVVQSKNIMFGGFATFIGFSAWAFFTVSVLILMEGLSAFLHTLRLHWVEFQSKFYSGLGHPFQPFSLKILK